MKNHLEKGPVLEMKKLGDNIGFFISIVATCLTLSTSTCNHCVCPHVIVVLRKGNLSTHRRSPSRYQV